MLLHIQKLRQDPNFADAIFVVQIEANLAYESDHHRVFLANAAVPNLVFMSECANKARTGTWTTASTKDQMMLIFLDAITSQAISFYDKLVTTEDDPDAMVRTLFRQLENYSAKFNTCSGKRTFTGKVGMEQDDLAIVIQMNMLYRRVFWKDEEGKYAQHHRHWRQ
jgi:hypothetical protein